MPTALSEQLADELGCSTADAERALRDVLETIEQRAQDGERVSLPGLGTFSMDEGTLQFSPRPALQQAVNYRNAHLDALSVSSPPSAPSPDEEEPSAAAPPDPAPPDDTVVPDSETADDDELEAASAEEITEEGESEATLATEEVPDLSEDWTEELDEHEEDTPGRREAHASSERRNTGQLIGLVASIVLLIGLVWFVLSSGLFPGSGSQPEPAPASTPADTAVTATAADTARPSPGASSDTARGETAPSSPTPPTIDRATGGWAIVVASRTRPAQAKAVLSTYRQRFQSEGIPVDILTGESNGQLRYRVAIGQYPSQEAAQTALQQLQGRVPDDAWTLQIQPDA